MRRLAPRLALLAAAAVLAGCGPRYVRETFYENRDIEIVFRARSDVPGSYEHPAQISSVRMAHILASMDVRFEEQQRKNARAPAVPVELVYPVGDLLAKAFAKAKPEQEIVVMAQRRARTMKLFTERLLTSFIVYMKNDQLFFKIHHVDFPMPKNPNERVREPRWDKEAMDFKVVPSKNIIVAGRQVVAVEWRDPSFRKGDAIRLGRGGKVERRTILLEEPEELVPDETPAGEAVDLSTLSPDALRALADLEEARRKGAIDEAEYVARRRQILAGAAD